MSGPSRTNRRSAALAALAVAIALLAPAAAAGEQPSDEIIVSADEFMALTLAREGPESALRVYAALTEQVRAEPEVALAAAIALQRLDRSDDAEALVRRALAQQPGAARLRLEYARLLYERERYASADFQFRLALGSHRIKPPERSAAARYLVEIDDARRWRFSANLALAPDSNINQATSADTIDLFGLPFTLSDSARATSGVGLEAGASAERRISLGAQRMTVSAGLRRREYEGARFDDTLTVMGAALDLGRHTISANTARRWIGGRRQLDVFGAALSRDISLGRRSRLTLDASARWIDNAVGSARDGMLYGVGASVRRSLGGPGFVRAGVEMRRFFAESDAQTYSFAGIVFAGYRDLPGGLGVLAEPSVSVRRHDTGDFFFPDPREDLAAGLRLRAVKRDAVILGAFPYFEVAGERVWSDQTLHDTARVYGRFGLTRTF